MLMEWCHQVTTRTHGLHVDVKQGKTENQAPRDPAKEGQRAGLSHHQYQLQPAQEKERQLANTVPYTLQSHYRRISHLMLLKATER